MMNDYRVTLPDDSIRSMHSDDDVTYSHAVVREHGRSFETTWHETERAALDSIDWHDGGAVLVPLWQCDNCDTFDDTTRTRRAGLVESDQCDTCIAATLPRSSRRAS